MTPAKLRAYENALCAIDTNKSIDQYPFRSKTWTSFRVFDSRAIHINSTTDFFKAVLKAEHSTVICIMRFEDGAPSPLPSDCIFCDAETDKTEYLSLIRSKFYQPSAIGVSTFSCASDVGRWAMVSDFDFGVIGLYKSDLARGFEDALRFIEAQKVEDVFNGKYMLVPLSSADSSVRQAFLNNYDR